MKICWCGVLVEDHVRFHWTSNEVGHYVDADRQLETGGDLPPAEVSPKLPACVRRASRMWGHPPWQAPAVTRERAPAKPWGSEDDLRADVLGAMAVRGFHVYDLEQGYREGRGGSRQTPGIGDAYFVHVSHSLEGWIETKLWDNEPSEAQYQFGTRVLEAGGIYLLVYEIAQVERWLDAVDPRTGRDG